MLIEYDNDYTIAYNQLKEKINNLLKNNPSIGFENEEYINEFNIFRDVLIDKLHLL